jgi:hypothetical protein
MQKLELVDPTTFIQFELQRSIDLVAFGLQAAENLKTDTLVFPEATFQVIPAQDKTMGVEGVRGAFKAWVLANGLRDFVDAIGPSLEWARKICFFWTRQGKVSAKEDGSLHLFAQIGGKEWNEQLLREGAEFEYWSLRRKFDFLKQTYGFKVPDLSESILSISYARNCLTHRQGIVGPEDIRDTSQNKFVVIWKKMQLTALGDTGSRDLELPAEVKGGEQISFGFSDASKEFKIGERIEFTSQEFVQLASTCLLFAIQIRESIQALQQSRKQV